VAINSQPDWKACVLLPERLDALLFALPALAALADSGRRLTAVTPAPLSPLAERLPGVGQVVVDMRAAQESEEAIVLSREPERADIRGLLTLWNLHRTGIRRRWGYTGRGPGRAFARWLLSPAVPSPRRTVLRQRHASEDFRELLEALGVDPPASWVPRLEISDELRRAARERLERGGIPPGTAPLVALIPGGRLLAERGERVVKESRWPWERFAELGQALRKEVPGLRCVLVAGREPLWPAVRIHEETGRFVPLIGPDLDAAGLAGLLATCHRVVGADSELLHLAAAVGTPTVALFGPTEPRRRAPCGKGHRVLQAPGQDIRRIEVAQVLEAVLEGTGSEAVERRS